MIQDKPVISRFLLRIPEELKTRAATRAKGYGVSLNTLISTALQTWLDETEKP